MDWLDLNSMIYDNCKQKTILNKDLTNRPLVYLFDDIILIKIIYFTIKCITVFFARKLQLKFLLLI